MEKGSAQEALEADGWTVKESGSTRVVGVTAYVSILEREVDDRRYRAVLTEGPAPADGQPV
jgi:hypothetical protein